MNEELQRLKVIIEADTSALKYGVKEAEKIVNNFAGTSKAAGRAIQDSFSVDVDLGNLKSLLKEEELAVKYYKDQIKDAEKTLRSFESALRGLTFKEATALKNPIAWDNLIDAEASLSDAIDELKILLGNLNAEYDIHKLKVASLAGAIEYAKEALRRYTEEQKKAVAEEKRSSKASTGGIFGGGVGGLLKRLVILRAIRGVISAITKAVREGIQYLAVYDQLLGNICGYNKALSALSSNFEKLKITISVTAMSLLLTLEPMLNVLMQGLTLYVEKINELFAALQGKKTYTAANPEYWKDYAEYVKDSNSRLRETKTLISGFDEINTVNSNKSLELFDPDNPLTVEKDVTALGSMAGALALLLPLLALLNKLLKGKNGLLNTQTDLTNKETSAVRSLVPAYAWATAGALAFAGALQALWNKLKEGSSVPAWQPDFLPAYDAIKLLEDAWERFKLKIGEGITVPVPSLLPVLDAFLSLTDSVPAYVTSLEDAWNSFPAHVTSSMQLLVESFPTYVALLQDAFNPFPDHVSQLMEEVLSVFPVWQQLASAAITTFVTNATTAFATLKVNAQTAFESVTLNVSIFAANTKNNLATWATNTVRNVSAATTAIANNVYSAFQNASTNVAAWVNNTSNNIAKWSTNTSKSISEGATSMVNSIGSWISSTASSIYNWAKKSISWIGAVSVAQGEKSKNKGTSLESFSNVVSNSVKSATAVAAAIGLAVGAALLAPYSGGAGFFSFANGGVVTLPTLALTGEYPNASSNPEIITPENKMRDVVDSSNAALSSVYILVGRQIIQAIENKDLSVNISDDAIGRAAARANNSYYHRTGKALI